MKYIVYKISNLVNNKIYFGVTQQKLKIRWQQHKCNSNKKSYHLYNAMKKYGFKKLYIEGYFEGDIKPIPLTEKLLVDYLGYEPSAFTGLYYDKEGIIDIKVSWDNKFTVFYKNFEIREVEYVHDLQNLAFALTK